jgi:glycosyltransferase involved in cell wall biosynthesis
MRIGFDASVLAQGTRYTGSGQYAENLLRYLPSLAPEAEIIAYGSALSARLIEPAPNLEWRTVPQLPLGRLSRLASHLAVLPGLARRDRLDVMHAPAVHTRPSLPPAPRGLPCPLIVTLHDVIPLTFYEGSDHPLPLRMRMYYRWNLRGVEKAARVITVSEAARREILDTLPLDPARVKAVHNGIDFAPVAATYRPEWLVADAPYILFGGSYEPRKNLERLLEAFDAALREGISEHLVMVVDAGSGHADAVQELARGLACRERLHFVSGLDDEQLRALYGGAEVFVFPSLAEGFGLPPLQAMACGVPVIASGIPALREVLGDAALYIDPYDVDEMTGAIVRLARDEAERNRLAAAGPVQAAQFSWRETAKQTLEVYGEVACARREKAATR